MCKIIQVLPDKAVKKISIVNFSYTVLNDIIIKLLIYEYLHLSENVEQATMSYKTAVSGWKLPIILPD